MDMKTMGVFAGSIAAIGAISYAVKGSKSAAELDETLGSYSMTTLEGIHRQEIESYKKELEACHKRADMFETLFNHASQWAAKREKALEAVGIPY